MTHAVNQNDFEDIDQFLEAFELQDFGLLSSDEEDTSDLEDGGLGFQLIEQAY